MQLSFIVLFLLLSPVYYANRWHFQRKCKRNPFYTSQLVRLQERHPAVYDFGSMIMNFPVGSGVYDILPALSGDVLQVGCGTGLLNHRLRYRRDIRLTNLDANIRALEYGRKKGRFSDFVHARIDQRTPLGDQSFDHIVFARSFHHVRSHRRAFAECERLLRHGGTVIIADPIILRDAHESSDAQGYMANSSIDGVIWRFSGPAFIAHLKRNLPPHLTLEKVTCKRQRHVSNYNTFVPQTDVVAILRKGIA